ncbi:phosphopantetheine-binding protein [Pseudomonas stutzeri]|uniref:phosphopantetheine-binding protein n=1 Tax=Stutzerimonas stutzeri TaxID=316 RepID=UPI000C9A6427|nr:phosphopantetheine-binding protein [Stutzerimonas stutzeri]MCQ4279590.1 phosphopantetheine-binding protein [Stutzerimonas stutzeri]PNF71869.1 acyl carrier protein [Stutzerimonas stutzeri]
MSQLQLEIKQLIIDALGLEDLGPDDIAADQPLFGDGLGLDSVDALELGLAIQKRFGIKIDADAKDTRKHFASVGSLAAYVSAHRAVTEEA